MEQDALAPYRDSIYPLPELVAAANVLLPTFLPKDATGRAAEDVNPRLVRFYTSEGLLPEAHKEGREARYVFDHLLALLVVRKLLAEGFGSAAIHTALEGRSRQELEALLTGEVQVQLVPRATSGPMDGAKAEFLQRVRARAGLATPAQSSGKSAPPTAKARAVEAPQLLFTETSWSRVTVQDGLEVLVRDDFMMPATLLGDKELLQGIKIVMLQIEQGRKKRRN